MPAPLLPGDVSRRNSKLRFAIGFCARWCADRRIGFHCLLSFEVKRQLLDLLLGMDCLPSGRNFQFKNIFTSLRQDGDAESKMRYQPSLSGLVTGFAALPGAGEFPPSAVTLRFMGIIQFGHALIYGP